MSVFLLVCSSISDLERSSNNSPLHMIHVVIFIPGHGPMIQDDGSILDFRVIMNISAIHSSKLSAAFLSCG